MSGPPNFFLPGADSPEMAEQTLKGIRRFSKDTTGRDIGPRRIFRLRFLRNGRQLRVTVGEPDPVDGEVVVAILDSNPYLVCTPTRGVLRGAPIMIGANDVLEVVEFAPTRVSPN